MEAATLLGLGGLFLSAFGAATIFPFQSEFVFAGMLAAGDWSALLLVVVASVGNTLGSCVNYVLGQFITRFEDRRWFPANRAQLARAERWYDRWGKWSLLLAWTPFIGDPLTVVAGVLRVPFWQFLAIVALSKTGRYVVLAGLVPGGWWG